MDWPDLIRFASDAMADRVIFVQSLPDGSKMKFHVVADAENCPIAYGYSHEAAVC